MNLDMATLIANSLIENLRPMCDRIEVAGSTRRQRPKVNDIDIVALPSMSYHAPNAVLSGSTVAPGQVWKVHIPAVLARWGLVKAASGEELHRFRTPCRFDRKGIPTGFQVDVYRARPETWGTILLVRTGSIEHNIRLCTIARRNGSELSAAHGVIKDGKVIASKTEEEIFHALGMPYVEPKDREAPPF